jgi:hypothetical protein
MGKRSFHVGIYEARNEGREGKGKEEGKGREGERRIKKERKK